MNVIIVLLIIGTGVFSLCLGLAIYLRIDNNRIEREATLRDNERRYL